MNPERPTHIEDMDIQKERVVSLDSLSFEFCDDNLTDNFYSEKLRLLEDKEGWIEENKDKIEENKDKVTKAVENGLIADAKPETIWQFQVDKAKKEKEKVLDLKNELESNVEEIRIEVAKRLSNFLPDWYSDQAKIFFTMNEKANFCINNNIITVDLERLLSEENPIEKVKEGVTHEVFHLWMSEKSEWSDLEQDTVSDQGSKDRIIFKTVDEGLAVLISGQSLENHHKDKGRDFEKYKNDSFELFEQFLNEKNSEDLERIRIEAFQDMGHFYVVGNEIAKTILNKDGIELFKNLIAEARENPEFFLDRYRKISNDNLKREKQKEHLQAQAEVFADKGVENFSEDQGQILKYSAELSQVKDLNDLPPDLPEELVALIQKHKDSYVDFLRQERKLETSFIEENIKTYKEKFQSIIAELKVKMAQGNFKELPEYLGSGSNGSVFCIEVDGENYAAKFSKHIVQANFEIKPLIRARGIPHTSQLVSYSFEDGVVVMELLPGTDVTNFTPEEAPEYPDEHIIQLIDIVRELDSKGLVIDPKPSNFMYDPEQGFSILDYHLKHGSGRYDLPQEIMDLRIGLTTRKFEYLDRKAPDYEEKIKTQSIERNKVFLPMMIRFLSILKEKYPDILAEWQRQHDENKKNPNMLVSDLIDRSNIPDHPDVKPYLEKLEEMGF